MRRVMVVISLGLAFVLVIEVAGCGKAKEVAETAREAGQAARVTPDIQDDEAEVKTDEGETEIDDVPQCQFGLLLQATVPPGGSVAETDQWPPLIWFDVQGTRLVMYAKHEQAYDPVTEKGRLKVWVGPPLQYIEQVEQDHPYGPADAAKYLRDAGIKRVFVPGGEKWHREYREWNAGTDRCVVGVLEPKRGATEMWRMEIKAEIMDGPRIPLYQGTFPCHCPNYPDEQPTREGWGRVVAQGGAVVYVLDQWGLPGCSPAPPDEAEQALGDTVERELLMPGGSTGQ